MPTDRVKVYGPDGKQYTVPADQVALAMGKGYLPVDDTGKTDQSRIGQIWDKANTGMIKPDTILKWAGAPSGKELVKQRDQPPSLKESPSEAFSRTFHAGFTKDLGETASALTSPVSAATAAVSQAAKIPGTIGKIARALLATQGATYGVKGATDVAEGVSEGYTTPEGARKILSGGAQVAGTAPTVAQMIRVGQGALSKVMPGVFAREEQAFVGAIRPSLKEVPALRDAYNVVKDDLQKANIKEMPDLRNFAEQQRKAVAAETAGQLFRRSPTAGNIMAVPVGDAIRARVTPWMKLRTNLRGQLPPEAKAMMKEATHVEQNLISHPINLVEAEKIVQDINAELSKFRKLPPEAQYQAIRSGDPVAVMTAVKEALQDQIESRLSGYVDQKKRYGAYKEIQNQTERRMNQLDRESGNVDWTSRRAVEGIGGAIGAIFSGQFLHGLADIMAGRAAGDIAIEQLRRPERMLRRGVMGPRQALPFAVQLTQTVAAGQGEQ